MIIKKISAIIARNIQARKMGLPFGATKYFKVPEKILFHGQKEILYLPRDSFDKGIFIEIFLDDFYGLKKMPRPIKKVIDIGANSGLFSVQVRNLFPESVVHAYEPNPKLKKYLSTQAKNFNFYYFMEALGNKDAEISLIEFGSMVLGQTKTDKNGSLKQVSFKTALNRLGGNVDLVKLDCEGAEWEILKDKKSWRNVKYITMEYHNWNNHSHQEMVEIILNLGFSIIQHKIFNQDIGSLLAVKQK